MWNNFGNRPAFSAGTGNSIVAHFLSHSGRHPGFSAPPCSRLLTGRCDRKAVTLNDENLLVFLSMNDLWVRCGNVWCFCGNDGCAGPVADAEPPRSNLPWLSFRIGVVSHFLYHQSWLLLKPQVRSVTVTVTAGATGWPVTAGVVEVGVGDTRWAVEVRVFTLHTGAGWAWWRLSVRPRLGSFQ